MDTIESGRLRASFLKAFASVPVKLRNQIITLVDNQPYTWESAFVEIETGSDKSEGILKSLKNLEIIE